MAPSSGDPNVIGSVLLCFGGLGLFLLGMVVLTEGLPPLLGALGLAAVFSAEVSTADTVLFMLSTSLSKDIYKRYVVPDASDDDVLRPFSPSQVLGAQDRGGLEVYHSWWQPAGYSPGNKRVGPFFVGRIVPTFFD